MTMGSGDDGPGDPSGPGNRAADIASLEESERLHIDVGSFCNNNCIFCMEEDRAGRRDRVGAISPEQVYHILDSNRARDHVTFVSGEPTLCPELHRYVRHASRLGFGVVAVISNGRRFAYLPYARRLVKAGLTRVILSIHGGNSRLHDGLVRTPGAFVEVRQGLVNLSSLRSEGLGLTIHTSTVLNRRNTTAEALDEVVDLMRPHVDQMVFNVMQPFGRGRTHFDRLMMRYTEVADVLGDFFSRHEGESLPVYLVDIPYCTTEDRGIPGPARGFVERYVRYQLEGRSGNKSLREQAAGSSGGSPLRRRLLAEGGAAANVEALESVHRDHQEQSQKLRRAECDACAYSRVCDGVWANYIERNGWEEFVPVTT